MQANQDGAGSKLIVGPNIKLKGVEIEDCDTLVVEGRIEATMVSRAIQIAERGSFQKTERLRFLVRVAADHRCWRQGQGSRSQHRGGRLGNDLECCARIGGRSHRRRRERRTQRDQQDQRRDQSPKRHLAPSKAHALCQCAGKRG